MPPFPPPPKPGSEGTARSDDEYFAEPNLLTDPMQVHITSSQISMMTEPNNPTENDDGATPPTENPICQEITTRRLNIPILPSSSLTKPSPRQRLRFDKYDHFKEIPTSKALKEGGD